MEPPRIAFAAAPDGVRIAWASAGTGPALVLVPHLPWSHAQLVWHQAFPPMHLASAFRAVWYDARGCGLSQREVEDLSLEAMVGDLMAVVEASGSDRVTLVAVEEGTAIATRFAAQHPHLVENLVLFAPYWTPESRDRKPDADFLIHVIGSDWMRFTETLARVTLRLPEPQATEYAKYLRACVSPDVARALWLADRSWNVTADLRDIRARTLVLNRHPVRDGGDSLRVASAIKGAEYVTYGSPSVAEKIGRELAEQVVLFAFPGKRLPTAGRAASRTILFTDLEGHTAMMSRLGDALGRDVLREHELVTREALAEHHGEEVKNLGDGFMASFSSAKSALECATALQRRIAKGVAGEAVRVRIGIKAGEPIAENADLFGTAVIAAARITALASGGQILVADVVRQLVAGKGFLFSDTGEHVLRGLEAPVRVWELRWTESP